VKDDFGRSTYRKAEHYKKVNMQQGRVQLDSDWNETQDPQENAVLVYLDVWERKVKSLDDPQLSQASPSGPDSSRRKRPLWRVRVMPLKKGRQKSSIESAALTMARLGPGPTLTTALPSGGAYGGLQNHLYHIEVHDSGAAKGPTFSWAKEEGSATASSKVHKGVSLQPDQAIALEDGVTVSFPEGDYQDGDFWLVPAARTPAKVTWPSRGTIHHFRPLAILKFGLDDEIS